MHLHPAALRLGAATILAASFSQAPAQTKWDLPAAYPATSFHTENLVQFAKDVEAATQGKLRITVHPNASLFKATEIKRAVQSGQAALGEILLVNFENENAIFGIDGLPFLATSYEEARKLYEAQKPALDKLLQSQGLRILYTVAWQPQAIYSKRPLSSVAEMRGIKWRAYSPATAKIAELVGAQPVQIQVAELSQALATGAVEAYMSSSATGYDSRSYESIKYFYDTQAWLPKNAVIVNQKQLDALEPAMQQIVLRAAAEAETRGWKLSSDKNEFYKKGLADKGMTVAQPPAKLAGDLRQVGGIMLVDWEKRAGAEGAALVEAYRKSLQPTAAKK